MRHHRLHREQLLPADLDEVWAFFADPANLDALTPPEMRFEMRSPAPAPVTAGQRLRYRIRLLPGVRVGWLSEITELEPGRRFVDVQRAGPYRSWRHEHRFEERSDGVLVVDEVDYALPFGPLGELVHRLDVRRRLERIFDFRQRAMAARFSREGREKGA